jgi:hypothetical protein
MIVAFANNVSMVAVDTTASNVYTDPHPVGDANYVQVAVNAHVLFAAGGNPTLTYAAEGSNDGQNWFSISAITKNVTSTTDTTPDTDEGDVTCAFIRFKFTLSADTGSGGAITGATFDLHANFTRK